jgi:hypothetical protein
MIEHRRHPRFLMFKVGKIFYNQCSAAIDCTIRNVSDGGACLQVRSFEIPDRFDLLIEGETGTTPCYIAWKSDTRIGVSFQIAER